MLQLDWVRWVGIVVIGSCIGSFLNTCIDRWPQGQSVWHPRSHCSYCQRPLRIYELIPIFSWLLLRGHTRCCNRPIPKRYLLTEILLGILAVLLHHFAPPLGLPYFVLCCLLWVAACADLETGIIPDECTLIGIGLGILFSTCYPLLQHTSDPLHSLYLSLQGTCWSTGTLLIGVSGVEYFLKKEAMGLGDIKLIGCIGSFLGWEGCLWSLFLGALLGTVGILICWCLPQSKHPLYHFGDTIPFGPFLALAAVLWIPYHLFYP